MRTLLSSELRFLPLGVGAELEDSRAGVSDATRLNTTLANPWELLQGYVGLRVRASSRRETRRRLRRGA